MTQHPTKSSTFRKLAATVAAALALGTVATTSLTPGVADADPPANHVSISNGVITYTGSPGIDNVFAGVRDGMYQITHSTAELTFSAPCTRVLRNWVNCPAAGITGVHFDGKGGNDSLSGGPGHDTLIGGPGNDYVGGGDGNDDLNGGDGMDLLYGDAGNDKLDGGVGTSSAGSNTDAGDYFQGGDGNDWVTYLAKTAAVSVSLDDEWNDGLTGERDFVSADVESITGTRYNDVLRGNNDPNKLYGTWGNDAIFGGGGADHLFGELGRDSLYGEGGDDFLYQRYATALDPDVDAKTSCGDRTDFDTLYRDPGDAAGPDCERINPT